LSERLDNCRPVHGPVVGTDVAERIEGALSARSVSQGAAVAHLSEQLERLDKELDLKDPDLRNLLGNLFNVRESLHDTVEFERHGDRSPLNAIHAAIENNRLTLKFETSQWTTSVPFAKFRRASAEYHGTPVLKTVDAVLEQLADAAERLARQAADAAH